MEDDALVTHLTIETGQLLGPLDGPEKESDVDLTIHVTVKIRSPMIANMDWGT